MSFTESLEAIVTRNGNGLLSVAKHWQRVRLSDVATILNGFPFPSSKFSKERGVPLLRIRDVLRDRTEAFFDGDVEPAYFLQAGDLVVGMDGDFNTALWRGPRAALNQRVCKISPNEEFYDRHLLSYVLPGYLSAINAATSSITVKHLSSRTVADIPLPLPPRAEQHRIVDALEECLSDLDAAVAALKRVRATLPRYRAAVLKAACEGRLVETEPQKWKAEPLRKLVREASYGTSMKCEYDGQGPPVLRIPNVVKGSVDLANLKRVVAMQEWDLKDSLAPGDMLVVRTNGSKGLIGRAAIVLKELPTPHFFASYLIRLRLVGDYSLWRWIGLWWSCPDTRLALERLAATSAGQYNISLTKLNTLSIPVPPRAEAESLLAEVDRRLSLADAAERAVEAGLAKAKRLRQAILKRAFEGKLVPQDPNDEPASVLLERIRAERTTPMTATSRVGRVNRRSRK